MSDILILEDDDSLNRGISFLLEKENYAVSACKLLEEAKGIFVRERPRLIICDVNLPDGNGLDFVKYVREHGNAYIICLTALDQEVDFVMGYNAGADDYITKPFSLSVLLLKVQAFFRRKEVKEVTELISGGICMQPAQMKVTVEDQEVTLTRNEWRLLRLFLENPKQILSKEQILQQLFDAEENYVDDNTIAVNINRLRGKLEQGDKTCSYIKNVRGLGYLWNLDCQKR